MFSLLLDPHLVDGLNGNVIISLIVFVRKGFQPRDLAGRRGIPLELSLSADHVTRASSSLTLRLVVDASKELPDGHGAGRGV